jgi:hypothetical protein
MKKLRTWLANNWRGLLLWSVTIIGAILLCFNNLESMTSGLLSRQEVEAVQAASSGKTIMADPLFLPHKALQWAVIHFAGGSVYLLRAVSALFGVGLVILFYFLVRHWFSPLIGWLTSVMMITAVLFLQYSRLAVPDILLPLALLGLLASAWWVYKSKRPKIALPVSALIVCSALYVPGMIWFTLLAFVAQRRHIATIIKRLSVPSLLAFIVAGIALMAPLGRAIYLNPSLLYDVLAIPVRFDPQVLIRDFIFVPSSLILQTPENPVFNLGRLPYLDIVTIALCILGTYAYSLRFKLGRTRTLIASSLIAWLLIAFSNTVHIVLVLPLIYLTVAGGILFLLQQWYSVFPKNPIARSAGMLLLIVVLSMSVLYNYTRYFSGWIGSPITEETFQETLPPNLIQ